jgi:3-deoxy-D-manno-octulosonate 8-phosphate phosphatase (KDO 8-P phosphatase)
MHMIKAIALDVDGVLTDGTFWWAASGEEIKRFSFRDVMGISLGRQAGLRFALISGEASPLVDRFAAKLGITDVFKGCKDKGSALRQFAARHHLELQDIAFVGDDVNDLEALVLAGLSAAPGDAHVLVRRSVDRVLKHKGGRGAARELVDLVLAARRRRAGKQQQKVSCR